ncbi:YDG domain-containing protein [Coraliomargarita algicola]|uniref:YDG domain-containing protein n=1 Tax=Coraliomargarita algicola TaxID=3092156 RepID=A0ABZ0RMT8_9BACT|nr:YDG domain-containing protein [Coraliomargarita sp. J2-16]WPJ97541.1 YDG domain-containing protein [Coraliomargarita sp. J2-16]
MSPPLAQIQTAFRLGVVCFLSGHMALAGNLPGGLTVVHGDLTVQQSGQNMQIHQSGQYGIADWDSFNVGSGYGVHFNNGSGATLNRVTGLGASSIHGTLSATGSLYLLNPNGIIIGADGQVLTGGDFVASTLEMANEDFLNGGNFTLFGNSPFEVTNLGQISSTGGNVLLAGYTVKNSGVIEAANGRVALTAGTRIDVLTDASWLYGAYGVSLGERGNDVTNEGRIEAMVAELRTHNGNIYALAGNNEGLIHATGVRNEGGRVILVAENGLVESSGSIVAENGGSGGQIEIDAALVHNYGGVQDVSGEQGGTIRITTDTIISDTTMRALGTNGDGGTLTIEANDEVLITSGGLMDASGSANGGAIAIDAGDGRMILSGTVKANGQLEGGQVSLWGENVSLLGAQVSANGGPLGGQIYVGGGYQGASIWDAAEALLEVSNSQSTYIGTGSVLSADAGTLGKGGTVVAWSDGVTQFAGSIFARGGMNGGDGGLVETSGLEGLGVDGTVDASARAAYGANGQWLLDPKNITIGTVTDSFSEFQRIVESDEGGYPTDRDGGANFGSAVDLEGTTLLVGAPGSQAAYVYENGSIAARLTAAGSNAIDFGTQVALTNGIVGVMSLQSNGLGGQGALHIYTEGSGWTNGSSNLTATFLNPQANDTSFGTHLAADGGQFYVAAPSHDHNGVVDMGAVYWVNSAGGSFKQTPDAIPGIDTTALAGGGYGTGLAASDGWIYAGWSASSASYNSSYHYQNIITGNHNGLGSFGSFIPLQEFYASGEVLIVTGSYPRTAVRYTQHVGGPNNTLSFGNGSGTIQSLDVEGDRIIVGQGNYLNTTTGQTLNRVSVTDLGGGQIYEVFDASSTFGQSVAISGDFAAVGDPNGSPTGSTSQAGTGSVRLLESLNSWGTGGTVLVGNPIGPAAVETGSTFGTDVAVDGNTIAIADSGLGNVLYQDNYGYVYIYENDALAAVVESNMSSTSNFGSRIDLSGDTLAVLNYRSSDFINNSTVPLAHIFERGSAWMNGTANRTAWIARDALGDFSDIAVSGHALSVIARDYDGSTDLLVWENTVGDWQTTINGGPSYSFETRPMGAGDYNNRIQMDGDTIAVYSPQSSYNLSASEHFDPLVVFENTANDWSQTPVRTELMPSVLSDVSFGSVFDLSGDTIVVGSDTGGTNTESVYVFERTSDWASATAPTARLTDTRISGWGGRVAVDDDTVVVYGTGGSGAFSFFERQSGWQDGAVNLVSTFTPNISIRGVEIDLSDDTLVVPMLTSAEFNRQALLVKGPFDYTGLNTFSNRPGDSIGIAAAALTQSLSLGTDITLQANNDITINEALLTDNPDGDGGSLSLNAGRNILVNASINTDNGDLTLIANDARANSSYRDAGDSAVVIGRDALNQSVKLTLGTGDLLISAGDSFENRSGSASPFIFDATTPGSFLVYANTPDHTGAPDAGNLLADLSTTGRDFVQYNTSFDVNDPRPSGMPAGSGFVYSVQPTVVVNLGNDTIIYGDTLTANLTLDSATLVGNAIDLATFGITEGALTNLVDFGLAASVPTSAGGFANAGIYTGGLTATAKSTVNSGSLYGLAVTTGAPGDLTVNKATLNVRPDDFTKTYGEANPVFTIDYTGFVTGDSISDLDTPMTVATAAVERSNVGGYALTATGGFDHNYLFNPTGTGLLTITARDLLLSGLMGVDRIYDATTNALFTGTASINALTGDDVAVVGGLTATAAFADKNVADDKAMSFSGFSLSGTSAGNYNLVLPTDVTANVTPATLELEGITAADKTYDRTIAATLEGTAAVTALGSDVVALSGTAVGSYADKNVGADKAVSVSGLSLTGSDAFNYVLAAGTNLVAEIFQLDLDLTGLIAESRVYDTTTDATLSGTAKVSPISGDNVDLTGSAVGRFDNKNVGTAKAVSVSGVSLTGGDAGNYNLVLPTNLTADVTPAELVVTGVTAVDRIYDATTDVTLLGTASVSPIGADEVIIQDVGTAEFANKNVQNDKLVAVSGFTLGGADAGNYQVQQPAGLTADITPRPITITGLTPDDKIYDATTAATGTGTAIFGGILGGDTVVIDGSGFDYVFADKNVGGAKSFIISGITLSGADAFNYTADSAVGFVADITPATLTVTGVIAADRIYNGDTSVDLAGGSLDGILLSDNVTIDSSSARGELADKHAGVDRAVTAQGYTASGSDAGNYLVAQPTGLTATISKASLQIVGLNGDKIYDQTVNAPLTHNGLDAVIGSDVVSIDDSAVSATYADKNAGANKPITISGLFGLGGVDALNYDLSQPMGLLGEIARRGITVSGLTIADKIYDGTTIGEISGTGTFGGAIAGDDLAVDVGNIDVTFADKNAGENKAIALSGVTLSGADADNYTAATPVGITATIFKKDLTVDGLAAQDKVYDRTDVATISGNGSLQGIIGTDSVMLDESSRSGAFDDKNVGIEKTVRVNGLSLSSTDALNYNLLAPTLLASITPANVGISGLSGVDRIYDTTMTAEIAGTGNLEFGSLAGVFDASEDVSLTGDLSGLFANKNAELNKPLTLVGASLAGADAGNYTLVLPTDLTADVTPANLAITGTQISNKVYDATDTATITNSGSVSALSGDTVLLGGSLAATFDNKNVGEDKPVAITGYTLSGADAANYNLITPTTLTASISQAVLTLFGVTANDKTYDGSNVAPLSGTLQITPLGTDQVTIAGAPSATFADKNVGENREVMIAGLSLSGVDAGNYSFVLPSLFADIIPRVLSVSGIGALSRIYDGTTVAELTGTASLGNTVAGDDIAFDLDRIAGHFENKHAASDKAVSLSGYGLTGVDADNYTQSLPFDLTADVTPKQVNILGVDAVDREYDATLDVALTGGSLDGVLLNDAVSLNTSNAQGIMATKDAGVDKDVTASGYALTGADASNYSVLQPDYVTVTIARKILDIFGIEIADKFFDGTTAGTVSGGTLDGFIPGDAVDLVTTNAAAEFLDPDVATDKPVTVSGFELSGTDADNYQIDPDLQATGSILPLLEEIVDVVPAEVLRAQAAEARAAQQAELHQLAEAAASKITPVDYQALTSSLTAGLPVPSINPAIRRLDPRDPEVANYLAAAETAQAAYANYEGYAIGLRAATREFKELAQNLKVAQSDAAVANAMSATLREQLAGTDEAISQLEENLRMVEVAKQSIAGLKDKIAEATRLGRGAEVAQYQAMLAESEAVLSKELELKAALKKMLAEKGEAEARLAENQAKIERAQTLQAQYDEAEASILSLQTATASAKAQANEALASLEAARAEGEQIARQKLENREENLASLKAELVDYQEVVKSKYEGMSVADFRRQTEVELSTQQLDKLDAENAKFDTQVAEWNALNEEQNQRVAELDKLKQANDRMFSVASSQENALNKMQLSSEDIASMDMTTLNIPDRDLLPSTSAPIRDLASAADRLDAAMDALGAVTGLFGPERDIRGALADQLDNSGTTQRGLADIDQPIAFDEVADVAIKSEMQRYGILPRFSNPALASLPVTQQLELQEAMQTMANAKQALIEQGMDPNLAAQEAMDDTSMQLVTMALFEKYDKYGIGDIPGVQAFVGEALGELAVQYGIDPGGMAANLANGDFGALLGSPDDAVDAMADQYIKLMTNPAEFGVETVSNVGKVLEAGFSGAINAYTGGGGGEDAAAEQARLAQVRKDQLLELGGALVGLEKDRQAAVQARDAQLETVRSVLVAERRKDETQAELAMTLSPSEIERQRSAALNEMTLDLYMEAAIDQEAARAEAINDSKAEQIAQYEESIQHEKAKLVAFSETGVGG